MPSIPPPPTIVKMLLLSLVAASTIAAVGAIPTNGDTATVSAVGAATAAGVGEGREGEAEGGGPAVSLRAESELSSSCLGFPSGNFDLSRSIKGLYGSSPHLLLETGDPAIDFTLHDYPDGNAWNLRRELEGEGAGKPVVLIWGMYTCPAFQGMGDDPPIEPWDMCGYRDEYDLVESYKDRATFVHLYGPEPHPVSPDTNFDSGKVVDSYWSTVNQPKTYDERLAMIDKVKTWLHPEQVVLPDYLPGNPYSDLVQPAWCSYGLGARPATAIAPDGTVFYQQTWLHTGRLSHHLDLLLNGGQSLDAEKQSDFSPKGRKNS
ncbi:unnamed protein product [Pylaiella littoralis]